METATKKIKVAKVSSKSLSKSEEKIRVNATLCYYYPAYTLKMASMLPHKHKTIMLNQARRLKAKDMHDLTQVAAAPHSPKGRGVKRLIKHFEKVIKNG